MRSQAVALEHRNTVLWWAGLFMCVVWETSSLLLLFFFSWLTVILVRVRYWLMRDGCICILYLVKDMSDGLNRNCRIIAVGDTKIMK